MVTITEMIRSSGGDDDSESPLTIDDDDDEISLTVKAMMMITNV